MKKTLIIVSILFSLAYAKTVVAQNIIPVKSTIDHNNKMRPCLIVNLDPEPKTLKNAWIDFLKHEYDFKLRGMGWFSNKDLLHAEEVTIKRLSSKKMDFYTYVVEDENGSEMKVFASLGYDIYLSEEQYPVEFKAMNEMMVSFLKEYLPEYYKMKIDETEHRIKSLNKEIKGIKKDIKRNKEDIVKLTKEVNQYEASVQDNSQKLKEMEIKLKGRQDKLERVKTKLQQL